GEPDATHAAAYRCTAFSPRGAASSSVTDGESIRPSTTCASDCARSGPADVTAVPPARNVTWFVPSCRRAIVATFVWQTVRQLGFVSRSLSAPALRRSQYWLRPLTGSV